jgi:hypothetical protein
MVMLYKRDRWVVMGVTENTRRAVTQFAGMHNISIAQTLDMWLEGLVDHMEQVMNVGRDFAEAEIKGATSSRPSPPRGAPQTSPKRKGSVA